MRIKIKGHNTHFTGEKEERMPLIMQSLYEVVDVWGQKDTHEPVGFFKRK